MAPAEPFLFTDTRSGELRRRHWSLHVEDGVDAGKGAQIEQSPALVGAAPAAALVLTDDTVSRYHLEIDAFAEGLRVRDLDSTNGTFVGNTRIRDAFLEPSDVFRVGRTTVRVQSSEEPAAPEIETDPAGIPLGGIERLGPAVAMSTMGRALFEDLRKVARSSSRVLFEGESGVGKGTAARVLHDLSARKALPFVTLHFEPGLDSDAADRLLFGSAEEGAPPGACERAANGTLFLAGVDHMPFATQRRLLRVIESGEVQRHGDPRRRRMDARLISSSQTPSAMGAGLDPKLLRRLGVVRLAIPPLRARKEDIVPIAIEILRRRGVGPSILGPRLRTALLSESWSENVDQLELSLLALPDPNRWIEQVPSEMGPEVRLRRALIEDQLRSSQGSVTRAAAALEVQVKALFRFLARERIELDEEVELAG
ncbi:MAG: sigma 54-interacting transcriptional regulator [Myxococcota bacterium]